MNNVNVDFFLRVGILIVVCFRFIFYIICFVILVVISYMLCCEEIIGKIIVWMVIFIINEGV